MKTIIGKAVNVTCHICRVKLSPQYLSSLPKQWKRKKGEGKYQWKNVCLDCHTVLEYIRTKIKESGWQNKLSADVQWELADIIMNALQKGDYYVMYLF